jgi:catechol 2,3-dioxygenase-like lactoylglutathione lyase family enzyme
MGVFEGIDHVGIYAKDPFALAGWYARAFDGEISERTANKAFVRYANGLRVELLQTDDDHLVELQHGHCNGIRHVAWRVTDCAAAEEAVVEAGGVRVGGFDIPEQDIRNVFFHDPEGNTVQITGPIGEVAPAQGRS